jgi:alpha-1,6-mannosyltransferase
MKNTAQRALLVCGALMVVLCYFIRQDQFMWIVVLFGLSFILYIYAGYRVLPEGNWSTRYNLVIKIILIFSFPQASDDIYRFFWDGQVWLNGFSAYRFKPSELVLSDLQQFETVYNKLNSKEYYSVYPPLLQLLFISCALISLKSVFLFSILWKSFLLIADQLTIKYLKRLTPQSPKAVFWYAWNPLVLLEVFGNGHPEGLLLCFLMMAFYYLKRDLIHHSAINLSIATGLKLLPAFLFPFFMPYLGLKKGIKYWGVAVLLLMITLFPVWPYHRHFYTSIQLYFKSFEFNGSVYALWKTIDYARLGYNNIASIGQWMSGCFLVVLVLLVVFQKKRHFQDMVRSCFLAWLAYLILSTTVHPWYILPVLILGLLSGYFFPVVWSGVIILSYSWYDENLSNVTKYVLIALEYLVILIFMVRELVVRKSESRKVG